MDWNNDGKKDLVVGDSDGQLMVFMNIGENDNPVLDNRIFIKVDSLPFYIGKRLCFDISDWNNDGLIDIIAGSDKGNVYLFLNSGTEDEPVFKAEDSSMIEAKDETIDLGYYSSPVVFDFNSDGKKDLICSGGYSGLFLYLNEGTDSKPVFSDYSRFYTDDGIIRPGNFSRIDLCDWNEDGFPDLVIGETTGNVYVYLNKGNTTSVDDTKNPIYFNLAQNFPNPFNPVTTIRFTLQKPVYTKLKIYNSLGQKIRILVSDMIPAGEYDFKWDGKNDYGQSVASGVYFYRLEAGKLSKTRKMILIR